MASRIGLPRDGEADRLDGAVRDEPRDVEARRERREVDRRLVDTRPERTLESGRDAAAERVVDGYLDVQRITDSPATSQSRFQLDGIVASPASVNDRDESDCEVGTRERKKPRYGRLPVPRSYGSVYRVPSEVSNFVELLEADDAVTAPFLYSK